MTRRCAKCGQEYDVRVKFCHLDGTRLDGTQKEARRCSACGRTFDGATFCPFDGTALVSDPPTS
jgi:hypothetical protein